MKLPNFNKKISFFLLALCVGTLLRTVWVADMEYKEDEEIMFRYTQVQTSVERYPWTGMKSGVKLPNPGMSVWMFQAPAHWLGLKTPIQVVRWVQFTNSLALFAMGLFALRWAVPSLQSTLLWGMALMAVNPMAVLFSRKIWACDVLSLLSFPFFLGWWYRARKVSAFFWGFFGILLGQVHMSGFFLGAALFLSTWISEFRRKDDAVEKTQWKAWLLGTLLGSIPLFPWLAELWKNRLSQSPPSFVATPFGEIFQFQFWRYWFTDTLGLELSYSLKKKLYLDFLSYPHIGGVPTYLSAAAHLFLFLVLLGILVKMTRTLGAQILRERKLPLPQDPLSFLLTSTLLVFGILISLPGFAVQRHYLIIAYPLQWVWLSRQLFTWKRAHLWLSLVWIAQLAITVIFLGYIHVNGAAEGDYGVPYSTQLKSANAVGLNR